ncbi:hypothetical protein HS088_TW13G01169 [Tripterygium wilfordii]|uniref:DC-UbP/UBTD2 N-terminal domain-containing protein n=1 Tax=Tripterygium wilfordii TaxID=458696 RepID=A0A7J7CW32_TRIWF|nr:hypothetical protein HS088_TW13G01169 [Tripterygium wilfordii]
MAVDKSCNCKRPCCSVWINTTNIKLNPSLCHHSLRWVVEDPPSPTEMGSPKKIQKPKSWKHPQPITRTQLMKMRNEFWDTAPYYGGRTEI